MKQIVFLFLVGSLFTLSLSAILPYDGSFGARNQPLLKSFDGFKHEVERGPDGVYKFSYHVGDSSRKEERTSSGLVKGEFAFVAPEGDEYEFKYEADQNGYRIQGDGLPLKPEETDEVKQAKEKFLEEYEKVLERTEADGEEGEEEDEEEEEEDDSDDEDDDEDDEESSEESSEEDDEDDDDDDDEDDEVDQAKYAIYARYGFAPKSLTESSEESSEEDDDEEEDEDEEEEEEEEEGEGNEEEEEEEANKEEEEQGNEEEGGENEEEENAQEEESPKRENAFSNRVSVRKNVRKLEGVNEAVFAHFGKRIPKAIYVRRAK